MLASAILIPIAYAATQSTQCDCSQAGRREVAAASQSKPQKVYHVGGDIKAPQVISSPLPSLNEQEIRQLNTGRKPVKQGSAILRIVVCEDGTVLSAKVVESLKRELDAKAIEAVKQWKFEPALKKNVPVAVELLVKVDFHFYK